MISVFNLRFMFPRCSWNVNYLIVGYFILLYLYLFYLFNGLKNVFYVHEIT